MSKVRAMRKRQQRSQAPQQRSKRLKPLRPQGRKAAKGLATVFRAGLTPSNTYGSKWPGLHDKHLRALRRRRVRPCAGRSAGSR